MSETSPAKPCNVLTDPENPGAKEKIPRKQQDRDVNGIELRMEMPDYLFGR